MAFFHLLVFGDALAGLVLAAVVALLTIGSAGVLRRGQRLVAALLPIVLILLLCAVDAFFAFPPRLPGFIDSETMLRLVRLQSYALPLVLGFVLVLGLAWPSRRPRASGVAELAPRGITRFIRPRWAIAPVVVLVCILTATLAAGAASVPDDNGDYTMYFFEVGRMSAGTTIYGWFYSVPCLVLVAAMLLATAAALTLVARPPLGVELDAEAARRRARSRNVLAAATGALLLHLGAVLGSLGNTAALGAVFQAGEHGAISVGTPFAAIGPALSVLGFAASALGLAMWWLIALWTIRLRPRASR